MTPMFDELDQELREALASEALPSAGFTDRVMARVAETPQQKKTAAPIRRWLVSAAACLAVAAALLPLLRGGGPANDITADTAGGDTNEQMMMQSAAPSSDAADKGAAQDAALQKDGTGSTAGELQQRAEYAAVPSAMDEALCRVSDTLAQQGYTLTVTDRRDSGVQAALTDASGAAADETVLPAAMAAEGFAAAEDGWYIYEYEEDMDS